MKTILLNELGFLIGAIISLLWLRIELVILVFLLLNGGYWCRFLSVEKPSSLFVKNSFIEYDIQICYFSDVDISEHSAITKMQDDGWEICGSVGVPQTRTWCGEKSITVPFRRRKNYVKN